MRIGIVNDSPIAIRAISDAILESGVHSLTWTAESGKEGLVKCQSDCPDLVLMDLVMPSWNGVETTSRILEVCSTAILVVTTSVSDNCALAFQAMGVGALDAISIPSPGEPASRRKFLEKLAQVASIVGEERGKTIQIDETAGNCNASARNLILLGASAGGPGAISKLLQNLDSGFNEAVVIVQHIDERFVPELASWLSGFCSTPVRVVTEGERLQRGRVYLSAGNAHLSAQPDGRMGYEMEPVDLPYRPSVDIFFSSIARTWTGHIFAAILTGMGKDGAAGLAALRARGHLTVAQDQASSALYGMPKAAADSGAASEILPLNQIAARIRTWRSRI